MALAGAIHDEIRPPTRFFARRSGLLDQRQVFAAEDLEHECFGDELPHVRKPVRRLQGAEPIDDASPQRSLGFVVATNGFELDEYVAAELLGRGVE